MGSAREAMSRLQIICHCMSLVDIIFFFGTIIASVTVEHSISQLRPMKIEIGENGTVTVAFDEKNELMAVWDYLNQQHYTSSTVFNAVYMSLVIIAVIYLILEIWLCCVLIRGSTEGSVGHCKRWFWWRIVIMLLTVLVAYTDLHQRQYTLTLLLFIPLNVFRMALLVLVLQLIAEYNMNMSSGGKMRPL